jgi:hypothetical protein
MEYQYKPVMSSLNFINNFSPVAIRVESIKIMSYHHKSKLIVSGGNLVKDPHRIDQTDVS